MLRSADHGETRLLTPVFLATTLATFAYFVAIGTTVPTVPRFIDGPLSGNDVAVGVGVGSLSVTALLLRPLVGRLGDRYGRRRLILTGASLAALSYFGYLLAGSLAVLVGFRLLGGIAEALFFVSSAAVIVDLAPDERRGEALSLFSLALYGGIAVGPVAGEVILDQASFDAVWVAAGALGVATLLVALRVPDTKPEGEAPRSGSFLHGAAVLPGSVMVLSVLSFAGFSAFVPLYTVDLGLSGARLVFLMYALIVLAIRGLGATIPDRLGHLRTARIALVATGVGMLVVAAWATPAGLYVGTAWFAVGQALAFPAMMTMAVNRGPARERGAIVGTFTAFFDLAFGFGSVALGAVADLTGYRGMFLVAGVLSFLGVGVLVGLADRLRSGTITATA